MSTMLQFGHSYHIFNRGNNRENLFKEERNYHYFLKLMKKYLSPIAVIRAYCLMPNHFHLLLTIKTRDELPRNIQSPERVSRQIGTCFGTYTKAINKAYHRTGSLFEGRFSRSMVATDQYYQRLIQYIHHNPERHGLVDDFRKWPFSSYQNNIFLS